jgi:uncharacterized membrane protein YqjE
MNGIKVLLITAEVLALVCLILLQFVPTSANQSTISAVTCMFAIVAVIIQSMQQDIKWKLD